MANKSGKGDKKHGKPTTREHFSPTIDRRIEARAIRAMTMVGVPNQQARTIVKKRVQA